MQSPLLQAGWTVAVLLGLYGFYCHWEASRAELAAAFHRRGRSGAGRPPEDAPRYRSRSRWSLLASTALAGGAVALSL
jgi:hypothetical protein